MSANNCLIIKFRSSVFVARAKLCRVLQSWTGRVPRVPYGGCAYNHGELAGSHCQLLKQYPCASVVSFRVIMPIQPHGATVMLVWLLIRPVNRPLNPSDNRRDRTMHTTHYITSRFIETLGRRLSSKRQSPSWLRRKISRRVADYVVDLPPKKTRNSDTAYAFYADRPAATAALSVWQ